MSNTASAFQVRHLRAPREDGQILIDPPLAQAARWTLHNVELQRTQQVEIQDRSLNDLATAARTVMLETARRYTAAYRDVDTPWSKATEPPIVMVGHQPELFHPGVWFKNFVLAALAKQLGAVPVHLICDNDQVHKTALRIPTGTSAHPHLVTIPFDINSTPTAHEHYQVQDQEVFRRFGQRATEAIRPLIAQPLIERWWPKAIEALQAGTPLGLAIAQARHRLEGEWGLNTLEVPLGRLCDQRPFQHLAAFFLAHAATVLQIHNECLAEYRRVNRVRSRSHPVPNLQRCGRWVETPFWIWTRHNPTRRPAWVRREGGNIELSDRDSVAISLPLDPQHKFDNAVEQLGAAARQGIYFRPRALLTTMFARLLLCDLFIHGIGGAKYDELTDALMQRLFGIEPPRFMVATCTALLPVPRPDVTTEDLRRLDGLLRELRFHPERYVAVTPETTPWLEKKRAWLAEQMPSTRTNLRKRHQQLERINSALQAFVAERRKQLERQRAELQMVLRSTAILHSREYAFCLFPENDLRARLLDSMQIES